MPFIGQRIEGYRLYNAVGSKDKTPKVTLRQGIRRVNIAVQESLSKRGKTEVSI